MQHSNIEHTSAISRGIKTVGIGKRGSKPLAPDLIKEILDELKAGGVPDVAKGAFFAALTMKGITEEEMVIDQTFESGTLKDPEKLAKALTHDAPDFVRKICTQLLKGQELDRPTAQRLGDFLLSDEPGDTARGIAVSVLRVRYETPDEYEGLLLSLQSSIEEPFQKPVPDGEPIIQLSEPFDGVDHSYLITPLIAKFLQEAKHRVVSMIGRNSGPKLGNNLLDIIQKLKLEILPSNDKLTNKKSPLGYYIDQQKLSRAMDRWVDLRRLTIKRPFFATLEKFLNPTHARIIITSAFHPPYSKKMATVAERAGFPGSIVVRNGLEGTIAFPLKRPVHILCSARQSDGTYQQHEFKFDPTEFLGFEVPKEERLDNPSLEENVRLIEEHQQKEKTSNELFDHRIKATCAGLEKAIQWVNENIRKGGG